MAKEVERKFLVKSEAWRDGVERAISIRQFYLAVGVDRSIRIRISDRTRAKLTLKFGAGQKERDEFEFDIPLHDALSMLEFSVGTVIEKIRYHVAHNGYLFEVDVYSGDLDGLIVAELETPDDVADSLLPSWIGREVTGDQRYSNAVLALSSKTPQTVEALAG